MNGEKLSDYGIEFCWCGEPEEFLKTLRDVLAEIDAYNHREVRCSHCHTQDLYEATGTPGSYWLWLYWLNELELAEHGFCITGSWLTPRGEALLALLNGCDSDEALKGLLGDADGSDIEV